MEDCGLSNHRAARTAVFWDMVGCPVPGGLNAVLVSRNIRWVLEQMDICDNVSIYAYGDKREILDDLKLPDVRVKNHKPVENMDYHGAASIFITSYPIQKNRDDDDETPEFVVNHIPKEEQVTTPGRLDKLKLDLFLWALDHSFPSNLVIIAPDITLHKELNRAINYLIFSQQYNIVLVQPQTAASKQPHGRIDNVWVWESLITGDLKVKTAPVKTTTMFSRWKPTAFWSAGVLVLLGGLACSSRLRLRSH